MPGSISSHGGVPGFSLTVGKTFAIVNSGTISGTDGYTLNVGAGGTLGTAAFTAASAYTPAGGAASQTTGTFSSTLAVTGVSTLTGTLVIPSTNTTGIQAYLTSDQVTNTEYLEVLQASSAGNIGTRTTGTGTRRDLNIFSQSSTGTSSYCVLRLQASAPFLAQGFYSTKLASSKVNTSSTGSWIILGDMTSTATSGTIGVLNVTPTYNQASGTAANTDLLINRTQTAVGSGAQLLIDAQVATVSKGKLSNLGVLTIASDLNADNLISQTAGKGLQLKSGTGARGGNATMTAGTVTVTNTTVTANTLITPTRKTAGGTIGTAITYTLSAGASFTINSDNPLDTSTFTYVMTELN